MIYRLGLAGCILFTVYGQLAAKMALRRIGPFPHDWPERLSYIMRMLMNPWIVSCLAAGFFAALSWMVALTGMELSKAYPFMSLNFVIVLLLSALLLDERLTIPKIAGVAFIVAGVIISSIFRG